MLPSMLRTVLHISSSVCSTALQNGTSVSLPRHQQSKLSRVNILHIAGWHNIINLGTQIVVIREPPIAGQGWQREFGAAL